MTTITTASQANAGNLHQASRQWATRPEDQRFETLDALRASVASRSALLAIAEAVNLPRPALVEVQP